MLKQSVTGSHHARRLELMKQDSNAGFIFFGSTELIRNDDVHFPFRQNSTFHYLTGFDEPNAVLILVNGEAHLFVEERDESREIWDGERYGVERVCQIFGVEYAYSIRELYQRIPALIQGADRIFYSLNDRTVPNFQTRDRTLLKVIGEATSKRGKGALGNLPVMDPAPMLAELRMVKNPEEIALIRKACSISARAHAHVLGMAKPGMIEADLATELQYFMRKNGLLEWGYSPIVASGRNSTTLHYIRNNEILKSGDLVLIDAGSECELYTADITQTFPVGPSYSGSQRKVYDKVLEVNRQITALVKPGISYRSIHQEAVKLLTETLMSLGVVLDEKESYRKYFPHGLGHYLGLDVHDLGIYQERAKDYLLKPGMIMTNEPGLYFRGNETPFAGIGVRIEDDLLITEQGCENLTIELPRDADQIEEIRAKGLSS